MAVIISPPFRGGKYVGSERIQTSGYENLFFLRNPCVAQIMGIDMLNRVVLTNPESQNLTGSEWGGL